jgi:hypothetical protein
MDNLSMQAPRYQELLLKLSRVLLKPLMKCAPLLLKMCALLLFSKNLK